MSREGTHFIGMISRSCYIKQINNAIRPIGKLIILSTLTPPSTSLSGILFSTRTHIREGQDYEI